MLRFLVCIGIFAISVDSARILGVFPVPSISHQVVFRALYLELAKRGHEVVIVTPNPALPKDRPPDNVTEIDVSFAYGRLTELFKEYQYKFKRGAIVGTELQLTADSYKGMLNMIVEIMNHPEVKNITIDREQKFDLILVEALMNYHLIVSEIFKAPVILFSSLHGIPQSYTAIGAIGQHPTLFPLVFSDIPDETSIFSRIQQVKFEFDYYNTVKEVDALENDMLKKNFGPDAPTVEKLRSNADMLFINSNPIFCGNRPLPPNVVYVGPLHLNPPKALPEELKSYLDNSKTGVIYVSLGTNVRTAFMDKDLLYAFVEAFRELPYDILWKIDDEENIENLPKNVRTQKWFPQRDLLLHSKVKLFVTQGGLQSADETIDAGVPVVGIPMLGDQYYNVHKYVQLGIGVKVDALTLSKDSLLKGINKVLKDESYKKNMIKLKKVMNDHPQSPLERAVWWTEYVIRHGGARHFRPPTANISWSELLVADVAAVILAAVLAIIVTVLLVLRFIVLNVFRSGKVKQS